MTTKQILAPFKTKKIPVFDKGLEALRYRGAPVYHPFMVRGDISDIHETCERPIRFNDHAAMEQAPPNHPTEFLLKIDRVSFQTSITLEVRIFTSAFHC